MTNPFEQAFPKGSSVQAFDEVIGWQDGTVSTHTEDRMTGEDGLVVRFDDGSWTEYPYSYIDLESPDNSLVRRA